jgi:hypothetical protein
MSTEWKPIKTAKKDGVKVLLTIRTNKGRRVVAGCWDAEFKYIGYKHISGEEMEPIYEGAWTDYTVASWGYEEYTVLEPTHWAPLPEPAEDA